MASTDPDNLMAQTEALLREAEEADLVGRDVSLVRLLGRLYDYVRELELDRNHLADQVAATERVNHDFRESRDELMRVQELSGTISGSLDLESILAALARLARQVVPFEAFGVFEIRGEKGPCVPISLSAGSEPFGERVTQLFKDGILDWAIRQGHPTIVPDPVVPVLREGEAASGNGNPQAGRDPAVSNGSFVIVPLQGMGRCVGVFVLSSTQPQDAFTAGEIELIALLARQAAIALENAHLFQSLAETNRKLRESQNQLVQAGKLAAVGQLAGGVAHEVNNPLQIILSRVQLLTMRHREVPRLQDDLRLIEANVKRISRIIRSLLDFARYNSGEMEWAAVDVAHLARQTCTLIQHQIEKGGVSLTLNAPDNLPKAYGNAGEIEQVFLNLLLNAQHATPSGGRIEIDIRATDQDLVMSVSDTGVGIPQENLARIFEPFFTTRGGEGGTGLGLSIIYGILEKHRGRIEVRSEERKGGRGEGQRTHEPGLEGTESGGGGGTTFTFYLPIHGHRH